MPTTHGTQPRGIAATRSPLFEGRFGRMFRNLPPAIFGGDEAATRANLRLLAEAMNGGDVTAQDGHDPEESGIPALYTYFGQFIDHDITFDPVSTLTKELDPDGLVDFRTPSFNLDNLYGRGPSDQPYMFDGKKFRLGNVLKGAGVADTHDLARFQGRAIIGDPRNDENGLVSQLQGLMQRAHNRLATDNPDAGFDDLQQLLRFHYQYVVLNDFLPRIIAAPVLDALKTGGRYDFKKLRFFHWRYEPFMPVEFSVAAYRLGHSMVRPGYRLNDDKLVPIFPDPAHPNQPSLTGFRKFRMASRSIGVASSTSTCGQAAAKLQRTTRTPSDACNLPIASTRRWSDRCMGCRRPLQVIRRRLSANAICCAAGCCACRRASRSRAQWASRS